MLSYFNSWHRGKPRKIQPGQKIHNSLLLSSQYTSKASPPPQASINFWKTLQDVSQGNKNEENSELYDTWVELDLYDHIENALDQFLLNERASLNTLKELAKRGKLFNIYICMFSL